MSDLLGLNLISCFEVYIGGGTYCAVCKANVKAGSSVCGAKLTIQHPKLDVICSVMKNHANLDITPEQAQEIVECKYQQGKTCFVREQGEEKENLWDLIQDQCERDGIEVTWIEDLGTCTSTEFKESPGILIDRHYGDYLKVWDSLTKRNTPTQTQLHQLHQPSQPPQPPRQPISQSPNIVRHMKTPRRKYPY